MKKTLVTIWLTLLCFLLIGNVHAWDVPPYLRMSGGARMWFSVLGGDLLQRDQTKIDLTTNLGLQKDQLAWEFFTGVRFDNIHVVRFRAEPSTTYEQRRSDSMLRVRDFRLGYDLDFFMSPQLLFGANADLDIVTAQTTVQGVTVGRVLYNYNDSTTRVIPELGFHGIFYPILQEIALRPNLSGRVNWMNYEGVGVVDCELGVGVDVPLNRYWTWNVTGGYRLQQMKLKRDRDTLDMNRTGFFLETSLLF
jgi:hypothetical protein